MTKDEQGGPEEFLAYVLKQGAMLDQARLKCLLCGGELTEHEDGTTSGHKADCPHTRSEG